jgi:hypothetical protein
LAASANWAGRVAARTAGLISIALWATVIMAGRMMAYTMY